MPRWRILLLFILISPAWVLADTHRLIGMPDKMRIRGNTTEAACYTDPHNRSLLIEFDDFSARDTSGGPGKMSTYDFSIYLLGCLLGDSQHPGSLFQRVNITFSGASDSDNPDYLNVQSEIENLAIEIYDNRGKQIHSGEPSPDYALNLGGSTLNFTAYLISCDGRMTSSESTTAAHLIMNYL